MLTEEQIQKIKSQLLSQLENSSVENKEEIKKSIQSMNSEQLESFLEQNKLIKDEKEQDCIFCSIIKNKISSHKIDENQESIAVLEINPISKGHTIIIPKIHTKDVPKSSFDLAEKIAKKLASIFSPQKVDIINSNLFGHEIINVLPIYQEETLNSKRTQINFKELEKLQKQIIELEIESKEEKPKQKTKVLTEKDIILPKRIP